ncbi:hypothetical protein EXIGLDRAFT_736205 [Exidia glandulosa HHB12029]|uniref:Uncharacterized protein n=1 Tax=Exidia glandulosa HHB12029 TaxID=1314781 RepID=A0A165JKM0_EXIGL|nr:hypothetical protein EXIGLDRAFT_736205 [Exidia glandulosa HHB12029]
MAPDNGDLTHDNQSGFGDNDIDMEYIDYDSNDMDYRAWSNGDFALQYSAEDRRDVRMHSGTR